MSAAQIILGLLGPDALQEASASKLRITLERDCLADSTLRRLLSNPDQAFSAEEFEHLENCRRCVDKLQILSSLMPHLPAPGRADIPTPECRAELLEGIVEKDTEITPGGKLHLKHCAPCRWTARAVVAEFLTKVGSGNKSLS